MPRVAQVEPLTTARALRGPFDYAVTDDVDVGSILVIPFAGREMKGVVTGIVTESAHELASPVRVLDDTVPAPLVRLALWLADQYCSTPARALSLVMPPAGARVKSRRWAAAGREPQEGERLTDGQRTLLAGLPRPAGSDLPALRRLEARGLVVLTDQEVRRAPNTSVGRRARAADLTADQAAALADIAAAPPATGSARRDGRAR